VQHWLAVREREHLTYRELSQRSGIPRNTIAYWAWRLRRESADDLQSNRSRDRRQRPPDRDEGARVNGLRYRRTGHL